MQSGGNAFNRGYISRSHPFASPKTFQKKRSLSEIPRLQWLFLDWFRYDYENCDAAPANQMMANLGNLIADPSLIGRSYKHGDKSFTVAKDDNFEYTDPIDQSVSSKQVKYYKHYTSLNFRIWSVHNFLSDNFQCCMKAATLGSI